MRELKVKLLEDVGNKGKDSVMYMKGNRAAKLINRGVAVIAGKDEEVKTLKSKELIKFEKEAKPKKK